MKYQDVLPGAHPKPGSFEFGVSKGPFQFGAGVGKDTVYALVRLSVKPQQIGNRELRPQADGHIMLSPEAEASHQGHGLNAAEPQTAVTVTESVRVPPETFLQLIGDAFFADKKPRLQFDENASAWHLAFLQAHEMAGTPMTMQVSIDIADLLDHLKRPDTGASPELLARIHDAYEGRVRELIGQMQQVSQTENMPVGERRRRIEPMVKEARRYGVLSGELEIEYRKALVP